MVREKLTTLSYLALGGFIGAGIYDLAIHLQISYNKSKPAVICEKGIAFEQIMEGGTVYLKTEKECINETMKGKNHDTKNRNTTHKN